MKKHPYTALLLCLVMLLSLTLSACEEPYTPYDPASDNGAALETAKSAALADLNALLTTTEEVYSITLWAWEYGSDFVEKPSRDRYLKAMTALTAAERALDEIEPPRMKLSMRQFQLLDSMGITLDHLTEAFDSLDMTVSNAQFMVQNLRLELEEDIHYTVILEALPQYCAQMQELMELDCTYHGYLTNYILLNLDKKDEWKRLKGDHPWMARWFDDWCGSTDTIMELGEKNLSQATKVDRQTEDFLGVREYTLGVLEEAVQTKDYSRVSALLSPAVSKIDYFPMPDFVGIDVSWLYAKGSGESVTVINSMESISDAPTGCYATIKGVSRGDVEAYADQVTQLGMRSSEKWDEEKQCYSLTVVSGSSSLLVQWTKKETVLYLSEPVGAFMMPLAYMLLYG